MAADPRTQRGLYYFELPKRRYQHTLTVLGCSSLDHCITPFLGYEVSTSLTRIAAGSKSPTGRAAAPYTGEEICPHPAKGLGNYRAKRRCMASLRCRRRRRLSPRSRAVHSCGGSRGENGGQEGCIPTAHTHATRRPQLWEAGAIDSQA
jgi:hypothetical protein